MREYKECYIAFLDLLGFKNLISDEESSCEDIAQVFDEIFIEYPVTIDNEKRYLIDFNMLKRKVMSDTICLYIDSSITNSLAGLISTCDYLQVRLSRRKKPVLLRGAIIKGEIYAEGDVTFGPGVSKAYLLEEKTAKYPRIILTKDLIDKWETHDFYGKDYVDTYTFRDFDAFYAVDYLYLFYGLDRRKPAWKNFERYVQEKLDKETNLSIREKYLYLEQNIHRAMSKYKENYDA